jgi:adenylylsulfate kinase-like enzyme
MKPNVIVFSGTMGAGKTTVMGEASDILSQQGVVHATLDLDAMTTVGLPEHLARDVAARNLATVFANFVDHGIRHVLVAVAVETRADLQALRRAMSEPAMVVCRLVASEATLEQRIRQREPGMCQEQFVARARKLDAILDRAAVEDVIERNDGRPVTEVAAAILRQAGWIH